MARPRSRFDSEKSLGDLEHDSDLSHSSEGDKDSVASFSEILAPELGRAG